MKILMVCLGNICRSPLAEGILRHKLQERGLNWEVDSAGTSGWHGGAAPHAYSCKVALEKGIDIRGLQSRKLVQEDFDRFDQIFVMDKSNYRDARDIAEQRFDPKQTRLLLNELHPGKDLEVPDPWSMDVDSYYEVFEMLDAACEQLITNLTNSTQQVPS